MRAARQLMAGLVGFAFWSLRPCLRRRGARFGRGIVAGILAILLISIALGSSLASASVPSTAIRYFYTPNNRLSAVIKPEADIWGTGFSTTLSNDTVKFHGTAATVSAATAYTLAVKVPTGATTGTVTVQTTTEGPVTSSQTFTVAASPAPTITSLSTSVAAAGTVITVTGTNFETNTDNDYVSVNQTMAEVTSATSTSLKFVVPGATASGRVSISTPHGPVVGPYLYIPPPGYTTTQIGPTANLTLSSASTLNITSAKTVGLATVEATGGEMLSAVLKNITIGLATAYVYTPRNEEVGGSGVSFSSGQEQLLEPITLPITGMYTILIVPNGEDTGKVELTPYYADTVTGALTPTTEGSAKSVSLLVPGQKAKYTVSGTAGEEVSLKVSEFTGFSKRVLVEWYDPEGKFIKEKEFTGNGFMESVVFPTTGTYTLVVYPYGLNTGSLKLTAYNSSAVTGSITPSSGGESKTVTTSVPGQSAKITFLGTAGERVSLVLSESTIKSGSVGVFTAEGSEVSSSGVSFGTSTTMDGTHEAFTLPKTGTYTILIKAAGEETGSVKLTAYKAPEVTGSLSPTMGGASESVSLLIPGQKAKYTVSGTAGEEVSLKVSEFTGFSKGVYVEWFNPEGKFIKEKEFTGNGFMESVVFPTTGTYTLVVYPYGLNTGSLRLTAYSAVTGSITPTSGGESKTVTTNGPGQNAKITFSGKSGEEVSLVLSESTIKSGHVSIVNEAGSRVGEEKSFGSSGETALGPVSLSSTGTYTIFIKPEGEYTGSVKLTAYIGSPPHGMIVRRGLGGMRSTATVDSGPSVGTLSVLAAAAAPARGNQTFAVLFEAGGDQTLDSSVGQVRTKDAASSTPRADTVASPGRLRHKAKGGKGANNAIPRRMAVGAGTAKKPRSAAHAGAAVTGGIVKVTLPRALRSFHPTNSGEWFPRTSGGNVVWSTGQPVSPWANLASPAPPESTTTALAGQALKLNGLPLAGLHVAVEDTSAAAVTDASGQFLLTGLPAGRQVLVVEGGTIGGQRYGTFTIGVQIAAHKETTLDAPIWMTPLDPAGNHRISSPTKGLVTITTPRIPGLEVRLPAGTVIHDAAGRVVRSLNITAVPVDRPPFPLPLFVEVPVYFTVQPGRAYLSKGAQIIYPNYTHLRAGARVAFWNYDAGGRGWYVYGHGSVTPNGKQVVPDPGVRVWEFTGSMITGTPSPPSTGSAPGGPPHGGDPVDLSTGLFDYTRTDLVLPDTIPVVIERSYRQGDSNSYSFGVGATNRYDIRLWSENNYHEADLILPDGGRVLYKRVSAGEGYKEAEYKATGTPSVFYDSTITWNESIPGWDLTLTNGTIYVFGEDAPLEAIRNRQGQQLTITREKGLTGNITQITSPHGRWVKFTYNSSNDITEIKDNGGRTLKYAYNKAGLLESATDPAERTTKYEYDGAGDMTSITDPRGNKYIENEYESHDRVSKQKMANGGVFEFSYALNGESKVESTTVTEPRESKRKVTFNSEGFQTSETLNLGGSLEQKTTFERQANTGFLLSSTDARSRKTAYEYDSYGNVTSVTHLAGTSSAQTYKYTYEPSTNELTKETDPLGHSTSYEYNSQGELIAKKDALGHTTHYEYNSEGELTVITNPLGHKTTVTYERGEPSTVTDPLGRTTKQFMDVLGRMVSTTTPGGQQTLNEYNNDNQLTKTTDPAGDVTSYEYDADGDLTAVTDPLKNKSKFGYTKMDLLESEEDPLAKKTTAAYDTEGNLTELTDRRGKVDKFTYDALNRLTEAKYGVSGETAESTIKYEYDNGNRLTKIVDSANGTYTPEYDELNRLKSLATPQGTIKYEYDEANRRTSMTAPGQEAVKYTYDEANRLKELKRGTQAVSFAYNEANLPTSTTLPDGVEEQYGYDEANELTSIAYKKGATNLGELDYSYDLDGRKEAVWGSYARTALPEAVSSAKYNADNEQTERGSTKFSYDANGNLTSDGTSEYTWNARNQLTKITGTIKASYGYDPFGRRTTRTLGSTTTELLYDGPNVVQEIQGGSATANLLTGLLPSKVFARTTSKTTENLLTDQLGSTIGLAGSTGSVETTYTYDPFGTTTSEGTASENTTQYAGQEDEDNGIYYDRARYYSPAAARFLSQDPTGQEGSGPNLYLYTNDSPTNAVDPYGTSLKPPSPGVGAGSGSAGSGTAGGTGASAAGGGAGGGRGGGSGSGVGAGAGGGAGSCNGGLKGEGLSSSGDWSQCPTNEKAEQEKELRRKEKENEEEVGYEAGAKEGASKLLEGCGVGGAIGAGVGGAVGSAAGGVGAGPGAAAGAATGCAAGTVQAGGEAIVQGAEEL
jgi:RHS repeat-associated protein